MEGAGRDRGSGVMVGGVLSARGIVLVTREVSRGGVAETLCAIHVRLFFIHLSHSFSAFWEVGEV